VEYLKDCPVYDYDEFLKRQTAAKKEKSKSSRRPKLNPLDGRAAHEGSRRRRRTRTVRMSSTKLKKRTQHVNMAPERFSFADVLLTAAEKLEDAGPQATL